MAICPVCGIDEGELSVADATDAIRSFPRRYREGLAGVDDDVLRAVPPGEAVSMLGAAALARDELVLLAGYLPNVLTGAAPVFPPVPVDAAGHLVGATAAAEAGPDPVLSGITAACGELIEQISSVPTSGWDRPFTVGDEPRTAGWIPRHAAHEGAHHLRDIARVRAAVGG
jgi:hypothetical protein